MAALVAQAQGARLVTTEKDFVRLPRFSGQGPTPEAVAVRLVFDDEAAVAAFAAFVQARLAQARAK
jgi:tetraacyldisaccharide-1-P 4'-kinase